jgi:hypothetical protein
MDTWKSRALQVLFEFDPSLAAERDTYLLICGLFNDATSILDYTASNDKMINQ